MASEIIANPQQWQNVSDCLKETTNFTNTIVTNVCDGSVHIIQNGFWDLTTAWILTALGIAFVAGIVIFIFKVILD